MRTINNRSFAVLKNEEFSVPSSVFFISPVAGKLYIESIAPGQSNSLEAGDLVDTEYNSVQFSVLGVVYKIVPTDSSFSDEIVISW